MLHAGASNGEQTADDKSVADPFVRGARKVGRNEPCPCGSGKNSNSVTVN